jgi:hypothetical protein
MKGEANLINYLSSSIPFIKNPPTSFLEEFLVDEVKKVSQYYSTCPGF